MNAYPAYKALKFYTKTQNYKKLQIRGAIITKYHYLNFYNLKINKIHYFVTKIANLYITKLLIFKNRLYFFAAKLSVTFTMSVFNQKK